MICRDIFRKDSGVRAAHIWVEISSKASSRGFPFLRSASSIAMVGRMLQKWP